MSLLPNGLKRAILPLWNAGHNGARHLSALAKAVAARNWGYCEVCGGKTLFLFQRDVIPLRLQEIWGLNEELALAFARKETCHCAWCGANLRARRLARALLERINVGGNDCVAAWVRNPRTQNLRVAEINGISGLHEQLSRLPHLSYSEFMPGQAPGTVVKGVQCQDLTRLTYDDASFDLVLTSETLEHVPDLTAALAEIRRILVPGGLHLFTIPWLPEVANTFARARLTSGGVIEHELPLIHHPGGDVGYPVFTEFGQDLPRILQAAGFETEIAFGPCRENDVAQVFICRKPL